MEQNYIVIVEYLIPYIRLNDPPNAPPIGRYGQLHKKYLHDHRPIVYDRLLLTEKLYPHLREIDFVARQRKHFGVSEKVILDELIYCY